MKYLVIDTEGTTKHKGHPFTPSNKMCLVGLLGNFLSTHIYNIEYDDKPYGYCLQEIQKYIDEADLLVLFNAKFDLHWLRRYGIRFQHKRIWDCQLVEFVLNNQEEAYPSLDESCKRRGLGEKIDLVKTEYWDKGIDTPDIPYETLLIYLEKDLILTEKLYKSQLEDERFLQRKALLALDNQDLLVLQEMEWNGLKYDVQRSLEKAEALGKEIQKINAALSTVAGSLHINWGSNDHTSAVLYGGTIRRTEKEPDGVFKTGKRAGQVKYRNIEVSETFPRLVTPLKGSELAKDGYWSTDEKTLRSLPLKGKAKEIVELLLKVTKLEKAKGTYFAGIPKLITEMEWENDTIHPQLNKCVVVTGRLSSSKPNGQNQPPEVSELILSRF